MNPYVYLFVRGDLSPPQQIVQTAHAVDELNKNMEEITDKTNFMVLFGVKDEDDLFKASAHLEQHDIGYHMFFEPDIGSYTAIATEPLIGSERQKLSKFQTMK